MGLLRLMGNKADVVKGLSKRCNEHWSVAPKSDIGLYLSDIQDHITTSTQNLTHYEKILSRSHSNYLAQISIVMTDANNQINDILSKLTALGTVLIPMVRPLALFFCMCSFLIICVELDHGSLGHERQSARPGGRQPSMVLRRECFGCKPQPCIEGLTLHWVYVVDRWLPGSNCACRSLRHVQAAHPAATMRVHHHPSCSLPLASCPTLFSCCLYFIPRHTASVHTNTACEQLIWPFATDSTCSRNLARAR